MTCADTVLAFGAQILNPQLMSCRSDSIREETDAEASQLASVRALYLIILN